MRAKTLIKTTAVIGSLWVFLLSVSCGPSNGSRLGVYQGQDISSEQYPASVMVTVGPTTCSGTFIAPDRVVTAAHCVSGDAVPQIHYRNRVIKADRVIRNPFFKRRPPPNRKTLTSSLVAADLAVLIAAESVHDHKVVCTKPARAGEAIRLVGYGNRNFRDTLGAGERRTGMSEITKVVRGEIIAVSADLASTRSGDSGGAIYRGDDGCLLGVTSAGREQGLTNYDHFVDLQSPMSRAFLDYAKAVPRLAMVTIKNRTLAPLYIQSAFGDQREDTLRSFRSRRYPVGSPIRVRYGKTCQVFTPGQEDETFTARLMAWRPRQQCPYGVGCLRIQGLEEEPVRHFTGCDHELDPGNLAYKFAPEVSFRAVRGVHKGRYLSSGESFNLEVSEDLQNPAAKFQVAVVHPKGETRYRFLTHHGGAVTLDAFGAGHVDRDLGSEQWFTLEESLGGYGLLGVETGAYLQIQDDGEVAASTQGVFRSRLVMEFHTPDWSR